MHVKGYKGVSSATCDVGVYLVHIHTYYNYYVRDISEFTVVMVVSGRVICITKVIQM